MRFSEEWLQVIVDAAPNYVGRHDEQEDLFINNLSRLRFVVIRGLESLDIPDRRKIYIPVVRKSIDLALLCDVFRSIEGDTHPNGARRERYRSASFGEGEVEVREALLTRIRSLSYEQMFRDQSVPSRVLWFWWGSNREDEVRDFIGRAITTPIGLRAMLDISVHLVHSSAGNYESVNTDNWSTLVDVESLASRARSLMSAESSEDRRLASRFLAALARTGR